MEKQRRISSEFLSNEKISSLDAVAFKVYVAIYVDASTNTAGINNRGWNSLSEMCNITLEALKKALNQLEKCGLILQYIDEDCWIKSYVYDQGRNNVSYLIAALTCVRDSGFITEFLDHYGLYIKNVIKNCLKLASAKNKEHVKTIRGLLSAMDEIQEATTYPETLDNNKFRNFYEKKWLPHCEFHNVLMSKTAINMQLNELSPHGTEDALWILRCAIIGSHRNYNIDAALKMRKSERKKDHLLERDYE